MTIHAFWRVLTFASVLFVLAPPLEAKPRGTLAAREAARGAPAHAMSFRGSGGWGARSRYQQLYDASNLVVVRGRVLEMRAVRPLPGMASGIQLLVRTSAGLVPVHLGPSWFVENQDARLVRGDEVDVTGVRVRLRGRTAMIAAEIATKDRVIKLRDAIGLPLWSWARRLSAPRAEQRAVGAFPMART